MPYLKVYAKTKCDDEGILNHTEELLGELGPGKAQVNYAMNYNISFKIM